MNNSCAFLQMFKIYHHNMDDVAVCYLLFWSKNNASVYRFLACIARNKINYIAN